MKIEFLVIDEIVEGAHVSETVRIGVGIGKCEINLLSLILKGVLKYAL